MNSEEICNSNSESGKSNETLYEHLEEVIYSEGDGSKAEIYWTIHGNQMMIHLKMNHRYL